MIATYKCYEIKNEVLSLVNPELERITEAVEQEYYPDFAIASKKLLDTAIEKFKLESENYPSDVTKQVEEDIQYFLLEKLGTSFAFQLKSANSKIIQEFISEAEKNLGKEKWNNLALILKETQAEMVRKFEEMARQNNIAEKARNKWSHTFLEKDLKDNLQSLLVNYLTKAKDQFLSQEKVLHINFKLNIEKIKGSSSFLY